MNKKDKLVEATVKALQGKLTESKYTITYFRNTATAQRRPQTKEDVEDDWVVDEEQYSNDLQAYEDIYLSILDNDEEDLQDLYEDLTDPNNDEEKVKLLKDYFEDQDYGFGEPIIISITGGKENYDSGLTKEYFLDEAEENDEEDEDYDEDEDDEEVEIDMTVSRYLWGYISLFGKVMGTCLYVALNPTDKTNKVGKIDLVYTDSNNESHTFKPNDKYFDNFNTPDCSHITPKNTDIIPATVCFRFWLGNYDKCFLTVKALMPQDANCDEIILQEICALNDGKVTDKRILNMKSNKIGKYDNGLHNFVYGTEDEILRPLFRKNKEFFNTDGATPFKL